MIISDLSFVEPLSANENIKGAEGAGVAVGSQVLSFGSFTSTVTDGKAWALSSPYGAIALGYTLGGGLGYTPPDGGDMLSEWQVWLAQYQTV